MGRFIRESMKPAVQMPNSDKLARFNLLCWGGLVVMVLMIMLLTAYLQSWAWPLWLAIDGVMAIAYATLFVWSIEGWFYRRDLKRGQAERKAFNEIIDRAW